MIACDRASSKRFTKRGLSKSSGEGGGGGVADMGSITMKKILITISLEIDQLNYNYMAFEQSN